MHGSYQDSLSGLKSSHILANLRDFPGNIATENVWQVHSGQSLAHPNIQMVKRTGPLPHYYLILSLLMIGDIFISQYFVTAELMEAYSFHKDSPKILKLPQSWPV